MGISVWQLLIVLAIVLVVFGAKRLRGLGGDLGSAVKSFREAVRDPGAEADATKTSQLEHDEGQVGEAEAERRDAREKEKQQV